MRPERLYLLDILEATEKIEKFLADIDESDFHKDEFVQSGVPSAARLDRCADGRAADAG